MRKNTQANKSSLTFLETIESYGDNTNKKSIPDAKNTSASASKANFWQQKNAPSFETLVGYSDAKVHMDRLEKKHQNFQERKP